MTDHVPTRRTVLAGALGISALGGVAAAASPGQAALGDPAIPTNPTLDFYLTIATIYGDSTAVGFERTIPVLTWGWGVATPAFTGGGGGSSRAVPEEFVFAASIGSHSPKILNAVNTARRLAFVTLNCVRRTEDNPRSFAILEFKDVQLTGYDVTPHATTGFPLDVVSLAFSKVYYKVTTQNPDGSAGPSSSATFDYSRNTV